MAEFIFVSDTGSVICQMIGNDLRTIIRLSRVSKSFLNKTNTVFPDLMNAVSEFFKTVDSEYISTSGAELVFWIDLLSFDLSHGRKTILMWMLKYKNCPKIYFDFVGKTVGSAIKSAFEQYFSIRYDYEIFELYFQFAGFRVEVDKKFKYKNSKTEPGLLTANKALLHKILFLDCPTPQNNFKKRIKAPILSYVMLEKLVEKAVADNNYLLLKIFELCIEPESVLKFNQQVQQLRANRVSNK